MANINILLNKIKNAILGIDVRDAIHDAIKQTYIDAIGAGNSIAEIAIARDTFDSLGDRLDNIVLELNKNQENINLNGYGMDKENNWHIDEEGNIVIKDSNFNNSADLVNKLLTSVNVFIDDTVNDDSSVFANNAHYKTLQGAINSIPNILNGNEVNVYLNKDVRENIEIKKIIGGKINIFLCSNTIFGNIKTQVRTCLYGGNSTIAPATPGVIMPSDLITMRNKEYSILFESDFFECNNIDIYGRIHDTNKDYYYAIGGTNKAVVYTEGCKIIGSDNAFLATRGANLYIASSSGKVNNYVFKADEGSRISVNEATQCNSVSETKTYCSTSSLLVMSQSYNNWDTTTTTGSNNNIDKSTKSVTYTSISGDTYRSTVYNNWKNDNTVRQGDYGYGYCNGCWFFGSQFDEVIDKNITKVAIQVTRQAGGYSDLAIQHILKAHGYKTRPSGAPSYLEEYSQSFNLKLGSDKTATTIIEITDTALLNAIKEGTCKGFGLQSEYNKDHYSVCSGNAVVTITYEE